MEAYLSLGAKFCPVELDIDRSLLEMDLGAWFRRLRLEAQFQEVGDSRTEEEKRFYLKSDWTPPEGEYPALDLFIQCLRDRFNSWVPPKRIKDNMTKKGTYWT